MTEPRPAAVNFVGVRTACCGQYARAYPTGDGRAAGACPRCGRRFAVRAPAKLGAPGTGVSASAANR
ncbi:hypothetical protein [Alienimonas sp. DA493]|uniref:hypothetical protein n=1 Tax=Alienimonas sp. DA493 TaxID=3373605 RepID=UPI003754A535